MSCFETDVLFPGAILHRRGEEDPVQVERSRGHQPRKVFQQIRRVVFRYLALRDYHIWEHPVPRLVEQTLEGYLSEPLKTEEPHMGNVFHYEESVGRLFGLCLLSRGQLCHQITLLCCYNIYDIMSVISLSSPLCASFLSYEQPRGVSAGNQRIPDASSSQVSRLFLSNHVEVLERRPRRPARLQVSQGETGQQFL